MSEQQPDLALRGAAPRGKRLNKWAIMGLSAVGAFIIIIAVVFALGSQPQQRAAGPVFKTAAAQQKSDTPAFVKQLPGSYADSKAIDQLIALPGSGGAERALKSQLSALERSQAMLRQQVQQLQVGGHRRVSSAPAVSVLDREAANSAIFFPGGAPRTSPSYQAKLGLRKPAEEKSVSAGVRGEAGGSGYESQNMQSQKLAFLSEKVDADIYNKHALQHPASPYILQAGSVIPAILQSKLVSNLPGVISAVVSQDVYDSITGRHLLVPKGTRLLGEYSSQIAYGQDQLQAKFTRLILPNGNSMVLPNQPGVDGMGVSGFEDEVNNHWGRIIGSAFLMTVFNIPSIVATNQMNNNVNCTLDSNGNCIYTNNNLGRNVAASSLQSLGQSVNQIGQKLVQRNLNIQPTVVINAGYRFSVMVTKDILF